MLCVAAESCEFGRENEHRAGLSLCKRMLSAFGIEEDIGYESSGRPYLKSGKAFVSVSHSHGAVCCAVNTTFTKSSHVSGEVICADIPFSAVGADIELVRDRKNLEKTASRFFAKSEYESFKEKLTAESFLDIYTKKEALVKQSGEGISALRRTDSTVFHGFLTTQTVFIGEKKYMLSVCSKF